MTGFHKRRKNVSSDDGNTADCEEVRYGRSPCTRKGLVLAGENVIEAYPRRFDRAAPGGHYSCGSIAAGVGTGEFPVEASLGRSPEIGPVRAHEGGHPPLYRVTSHNSI